MAVQEDNVVYREVQRWSLKFRLILLVPLLFTAVVGALATVRTIMDDSAGLATAIIIGFCGVLVPLGIAVLIWVNRLETEVHTDSLCVRYFPFHGRFKSFSPEDLSECRARRYRPILEYGGWGIRWGRKGRAYNVSGNEGVQLVFKDGGHLLIGSARPGQLEQAINSIL